MFFDMPPELSRLQNCAAFTVLHADDQLRWSHSWRVVQLPLANDAAFQIGPICIGALALAVTKLLRDKCSRMAPGPTLAG